MKNDQMDDEAELKKRGLASADKVGFFERIRMGNIDDPSSEAYKRFGAGRGRSEAVKTKASTVDQIGDRERREGEMASLLKNKPTKSAASQAAPTKTTAKPAIVTKEQMKKAGFDNLRDYLNAQQGKTRRKTDTDIITEGATKMYNESFGKMKPMTMDQIKKARELTDGMSDTAMSQQGQFGTMKKGGAVKKYKEGGTVSSASRRGDGIALRGKTRGKMV
jgi:hypothetical protein